MTWSPDSVGLADLSPAHKARLAALPAQDIPAGVTLFHAGDPVQGYVIVLSGRVDVSLTGASGRAMLLYSVEPGQSCIQTTMGLLGDTAYSAEGQTAAPSRLVMLPRALFLTLMEDAPAFRGLVFAAFAARMKTMLALLERLAFTRVECRLADRLLELSADGPLIRVTQADLAVQVGTAREVVSRRLEAWARAGYVRTGRGTVEICDAPALAAIAAGDL